MVAIRAGPMAAAAALLRLLPALLLLLSCCCPRHASAARAVFAVRDAAAISAGRPLGSSGSRVLLQEERNKLIDTGAVAGEPAFAIPTSSPIVSAPPATPGPDVQQPPSPGFAPPTAGGAIPTSPIISGAQPEDQHREVTPPPVVVAQPPPLAPAPVPEVQQKKNRTEPTDEPAAGGEELGALPTPAVSVAQPEGQRQQEPTEPVAPPLAAVPTALGNETGDALVPATSIIPITEANETTTLREGTVGNATVLPEAPTAAPAPGTSLNETQQQQLPGNATLPSGNATLPSDAVILPGDVEAAPEAAANIKEPAGEAQTELLGGLQPGEVLTKPEEVDAAAVEERSEELQGLIAEEGQQAPEAAAEALVQAVEQGGATGQRAAAAALVQASTAGKVEAVAQVAVQVAVRSPTAAATALAESAVVAEQRGTVVQYAEAQARAFAYASTQIAVEAWSAAVARSIAYSRASVVVYGRSFYRCLTLGAIYQRALVESYASSLCRGWAWAEAYSLAYLQTIEIDPVTGCTTLTTITTESAARCYGTYYEAYTRSSVFRLALGRCGLLFRSPGGLLLPGGFGPGGGFAVGGG